MDVDELSARLQEISSLLNARRTVRPGSLRSHLPIVGPLVTGVRRLWNAMAGKWYVDPLVDDLNRFGEAVARSFDGISELLVQLAWEIEQHRTRLEEHESGKPADQAVATPRPGPVIIAGEAPPRTEDLADNERYWDEFARTSLLRAKEEILTRHPGEDEETYLRRFEEDGAKHAAWLAPYYQPESRVLEIGCGIGRILKYIRAKERWGLDISQGMLEWATVYLAGQEGIHLVKTNGFDFSGVPSDYFDLVYSLLVLQHINKRAGFNYMQETYRVLKPGGRFYFQMMNLLSEEGFQQFRAAVPVEYRYCPLYFYTPEEARYLLTRIGLVVDDLSTSGDSIYVVGHKPAV
ncbi:MAG: class I SAM-dependent methyltransferase [Chloroflexia bacterium]